MNQMNTIRADVLNEIKESLCAIPQADIDVMIKVILGSRRVFICGQGREDISCRAFCMRLNHLGLKAFHVGDPCTPPIDQEDLLVISCAGPKLGTLHVYKEEAEDVGARTILFTNKEIRGDFDGHWDLKISIPIPQDTIQPQGAVYEQVLWLAYDYVEYLLQDFVGGDEQDRVGRHANIL